MTTASQSRTHSLLESFVNVAVGYGIALATQMVVFPMLGLHVTLHDNVVIGLIFTAVSIARSYALRRLFNLLHVRQVSLRHLCAICHNKETAQ